MSAKTFLRSRSLWLATLGFVAHPVWPIDYCDTEVRTVLNEDDTLFSPARMTVLHNGVLIQNHIDLHGATRTPRGRGPIILQAHPDPSPPISFRNIWVRELATVGPQAPATLQTPTPSLKGSLTVDSTVGRLMDNPTLKEVLSRCVPELFPHPTQSR